MHERVFFSFTNHLQNPDKLPWNSIKNKKLFPSKLFISNKSMLLISEIFCEVLICTYYRLFFSRSIAQSFYKNLHGLFWQFISWTNWVNSGKFCLQVILFEIDCTIFYTNLHDLFCQFISWTNWVNSAKFMDNRWISCQVMAVMKIFYNDLIIINL